MRVVATPLWVVVVVGFGLVVGGGGSGWWREVICCRGEEVLWCGEGLGMSRLPKEAGQMDRERHDQIRPEGKPAGRDAQRGQDGERGQTDDQVRPAAEAMARRGRVEAGRTLSTRSTPNSGFAPNASMTMAC